MAILDPFYYLTNFGLVLSAIRGRYRDLLAPEESRFLAQFPCAPKCAQALLARMVMRQGDLFRSGKLRYPEIGDTHAAALPLIEAGWVDNRPRLDVEQLQGIMSKPELLRCLGQPQRYGAWKKPALLAMLKSQFKETREFSGWDPFASEEIYALTVAPICERFRIMYFGNDRQSWTEFVTADMKIFSYEKLDHTQHSRAFQTRAQIDAFQQLQACAESLQLSVPLEEIHRAVPQFVPDCDWLEHQRQKLLFGIAREHERAGNGAAALGIYRQCTYRGARLRAIRITAQIPEWASVRRLCLLALEQPESEAELQHVRRLIARANRKLGITDVRAAPAPAVPEFELLLADPAGGRAVECQVRDHLARDAAADSTVRYVENGLINSLFGLLCWRAIFAPIAGAFFHDFHHGPADLASGHFYRRREAQFQACFSELDSDCYRHTIWRTFKQKWGIQSPFVRWQSLDRTLLSWALECFPAAHLRLWFEWMVRDIQDNRAGFPDLIQFWPGERRYRMIEVKGPGDRIQDNQRRFLEFCAAHQMPAAVCYARFSSAA